MTRTLAAAIAAALAIALAPTATGAAPDPFEPNVIEHGVATADGGVPGNGDLTYCPSDGVWSLEWHDCPPVDPTVGIEEDDPRWDCRTMGNRECGPGNSQGVPAGDYGEIDYEAHTEWLIDTNEGR